MTWFAKDERLLDAVPNKCCGAAGKTRQPADQVHCEEWRVDGASSTLCSCLGVAQAAMATLTPAVMEQFVVDKLQAAVAAELAGENLPWKHADSVK